MAPTLTPGERATTSMSGSPGAFSGLSPAPPPAPPPMRDRSPMQRHCWQLLALVMVGAAIPLTELMVTTIFTEIITKGERPR